MATLACQSPSDASKCRVVCEQAFSDTDARAALLLRDATGRRVWRIQKRPLPAENESTPDDLSKLVCFYY